MMHQALPMSAYAMLTKEEAFSGKFAGNPNETETTYVVASGQCPSLTHMRVITSAWQLPCYEC
jgi:hypothetical protein